MFMLAAYSPMISEPPNFSRFVSSFSLLVPGENALPARAPQDSTYGVLLILAIVGATADWRYKKKGGVRPTVRERLYFGLAGVLCLALLILLGVHGSNAEALGSLSGFLAILLFVAWELGRWRVRRQHPLPSSKPFMPPPLPRA